MVCYAAQNDLLKLAEGNSGEIPSCVTTSADFFIGTIMKRISLTQGQFAIVDDEDYERLIKCKWVAHWHRYTQSFYAIRREKGEDGKWHTISMAREVLGLARADKREPDHINHITLDNRTSNLRAVTHQQNTFNRKKPAKGYYGHKTKQKYIVRIMLNNKSIYLGCFRTAKTAHNAYLKAKEKYHKI